jgi:hypothetical protein
MMTIWSERTGGEKRVEMNRKMHCAQRAKSKVVTSQEVEI